jgi:hypothetical protein
LTVRAAGHAPVVDHDDPFATRLPTGVRLRRRQDKQHASRHTRSRRQRWDDGRDEG